MTVIVARDSPVYEDIPCEYLLPSVSPLRRAFLLRQMLALPTVTPLLHDCTHIHTLVEPYAPLGALIAGVRPLIMTAHGTYTHLPERAFPSGAVYAWAFRRAHAIAVSTYTADILRRHTGDRIPTVIPNGVEAERYMTQPRQRSAFPSLLFVGGVKPRKGVIELVRAFAKVREQLPDARLWIIGSLTLDRAYVAALQVTIDELGLSGSVEMLGRLSDRDLLSLYSQAWAFVLAAQTVEGSFEGFGLALLEASAAGVPVVSTHGGGTADAVRDGETGLLVPQDDPAALTGALLRILTDHAFADQLGSSGRAYAAAQTWDRVAQKVIALYASLTR